MAPFGQRSILFLLLMSLLFSFSDGAMPDDGGGSTKGKDVVDRLAEPGVVEL